MTKERIAEFREEYNKAKESHLMSFTFHGEEYSLGYASFLLNYELPKKYGDELVNTN